MARAPGAPQRASRRSGASRNSIRFSEVWVPVPAYTPPVVPDPVAEFFSGEATLPTGQVTFLFTDIEGSTRLLHRLGSAYADLLERHNEILARAIVDGGGTKVGSEGDSVFAVFPDAARALAAAAGGRAGTVATAIH